MMLGGGITVYARLLALDCFGLTPRLVKHIARGDPRLDSIDAVVIGERNRIALAALPPGGDAVLLWDAMHLPGLGTGLRNAGYRRQSIEWETVGTVPALHASVRAIWTALRSS